MLNFASLRAIELKVKREQEKGWRIIQLHSKSEY